MDRANKRIKTFEELKELLTRDFESSQVSERNIAAYDNPNWAYRQAHMNGYLKAIHKMLRLIDLDERKEESNGPNSNGPGAPESQLL